MLFYEKDATFSPIIAKIAPSSAPASKATKGFVFLTMRKITTAGTINNARLILKELSITDMIAEESAAFDTSRVKPINKKTTSVMTIDGNWKILAEQPVTHIVAF